MQVPLLSVSSNIELAVKGDVAVGVVVHDADGVLVVVDQLPVASVPVERGEGSGVLLEVLEASPGGEVVGGVGLDLGDQHLPFLGALGGQSDLNGDEAGAQVLDGEVEMLASENSTEGGGEDLVGHRVRAHDGHRLVGAHSHLWSRNVELDKVNPHLLNCVSCLVDRPSVRCLGCSIRSGCALNIGYTG